MDDFKLLLGTNESRLSPDNAERLSNACLVVNALGAKVCAAFSSSPTAAVTAYALLAYCCHLVADGLRIAATVAHTRARPLTGARRAHGLALRPRDDSVPDHLLNER